MNWTLDILQGEKSQVGHAVLENATHLLMYGGGHHNEAGLSEFLQPARDIDVTAENVVALGDDVSEMNGDSNRQSCCTGIGRTDGRLKS